MTYCEEIGLKVGDKIRVLRDGLFYETGTVLTLSCDDGTKLPWFTDGVRDGISFGLTGRNSDSNDGLEGIGWERVSATALSTTAADKIKSRERVEQVRGMKMHPDLAAPYGHDPVNKPNHYMLFPEQGIEFIDVRDVLIERLKDFTPKQIDYWSRAFEYLARAGGKNGVEDIKKAKWYLDRLVVTLEE